MKQQSLLSASQSPLSRSQRWLARLGLHGKIPLKGATKGLRPVLSKSKLLPPFISITSHQNSSPTEVATVPLAIKIMLGHVMLVCDCTARNKTSGSGNDAGSWVVNLERCRQKPSLIPLKIKLKKKRKERKQKLCPLLHISVQVLLGNIKQGGSETELSHLCLLYHILYTVAKLKREGGLFWCVRAVCIFGK